MVFFPFTVCEGGRGGGGGVGQRGGKLKCFAKIFARKKTHVKLVIIDWPLCDTNQMYWKMTQTELACAEGLCTLSLLFKGRVQGITLSLLFKGRV
jgi:hypothetical protein